MKKNAVSSCCCYWRGNVNNLDNNLNSVSDYQGRGVLQTAFVYFLHPTKFFFSLAHIVTSKMFNNRIHTY